MSVRPSRVVRRGPSVPSRPTLWHNFCSSWGSSGAEFILFDTRRVPMHPAHLLSQGGPPKINSNRFKTAQDTGDGPKATSDPPKARKTIPRKRIQIAPRPPQDALEEKGELHPTTLPEAPPEKPKSQINLSGVSDKLDTGGHSDKKCGKKRKGLTFLRSC